MAEARRESEILDIRCGFLLEASEHTQDQIEASQNDMKCELRRGLSDLQDKMERMMKESEGTNQRKWQEEKKDLQFELSAIRVENEEILGNHLLLRKERSEAAQREKEMIGRLSVLEGENRDLRLAHTVATHSITTPMEKSNSMIASTKPFVSVTTSDQTLFGEITSHITIACDTISTAVEAAIDIIDGRTKQQLLAISGQSDKLDTAMLDFEQRQDTALSGAILYKVEMIDRGEGRKGDGLNDEIVKQSLEAKGMLEKEMMLKAVDKAVESALQRRRLVGLMINQQAMEQSLAAEEKRQQVKKGKKEETAAHQNRQEVKKAKKEENERIAAEQVIKRARKEENKRIAAEQVVLKAARVAKAADLARIAEIIARED